MNEPSLDSFEADFPSEHVSPGQNRAEIHPALSVLVLRALQSLFDLGFESESNVSRICSLLRKHAQVPRSELLSADIEGLGAICRRYLPLLEQQADAAPPHPSQTLVRELGVALGLDEAEQAITQVSVACVMCQDVQRAMDLASGNGVSGSMDTIAFTAGVSSIDVFEILSKPSLLRGTGNTDFGHSSPSDCIELHWSVVRLIKGGVFDVERIVRVFIRTAPPAELKLEQFKGQTDTLDLVVQLVRGVLARPRQGVNILIHGAPGTGKTQFVRALAEALDARLVEVAAADADGDPILPQNRVGSLQSCQRAIARMANGLVLFDEAEDIFPCDAHELFRRSRRSDRHKGWLTSVLEENQRPVFWVCNRISQIDPAYLRRFDVVMEMRGPGREARRDLVRGMFADAGIESAMAQELERDMDLSPAHLQKLANVICDLRTAGVESVDGAASCLLGELRKAHGKRMPAPVAATIRYRPECLQADTDLDALAHALRGAQEARICLFGPPGTGKTEWARHVARISGRELVSKRGSDLLGPYVGQTEANIAAAFEEAEARDAMLLVDEADSFLRRRETARASWEVGMVNEFLQSLERFRGICVVTTNFMEGLDQACARRFDFKVRFDWLQPSQKELLYREVLAELGLEVPEANVLDQVRQASFLAPGDFANVARQNRVIRVHPSAAAIAQALLREAQFKDQAIAQRRIGFV